MRTPKLSRHKGKSLGYVTLNGKEHYLGAWPRGQRTAPPAVRAEYDALIGRWLANGRKLPAEEGEAAPTPVTVNSIILAFVPYAEAHYTQKEKGANTEVEAIKAACKVLTALFGRLPVSEFGPKALKLVRAKMLEQDWSRTYTNHQINRLKRMFRWAVAEEMMPGSILHNLQAVAAIRRGEPGVRETEPVRPVPQELIDAALPHMTEPVAAMVRLQALTGARPGEIVIIRGRDIDRTGVVWVFRPEHHKNRHRGMGREVYIGPKARVVLSLWLKDDPDAYLFSPKESESERNAERSRGRVVPLYPSHAKRNAAKGKGRPGRRPKGACYTVHSYRRSITYACRKANALAVAAAVENARESDPNADVSAIETRVFVPAWSPNRLRHNAATQITREKGIEMARLVCGHKHGFTTEIYAERDRESVLAVVEELG